MLIMFFSAYFFQPTFLHMAPPLLSFVVNHDDISEKHLESLHYVMTAAAPTGPTLYQQFHKKAPGVILREGLFVLLSFVLLSFVLLSFVLFTFIGIPFICIAFICITSICITSICITFYNYFHFGILTLLTEQTSILMGQSESTTYRQGKKS